MRCSIPLSTLVWPVIRKSSMSVLRGLLRGLLGVLGGLLRGVLRGA